MEPSIVALNFGNLPLTEVVMRVTLGEQLPLTLSFLGDLYDLISEDFSFSESMAMEAPPGLSRAFVIEGIGVANLNHRSVNGVTARIQNQLVKVSWRNILDAKYPGFTVLLPILQKILDSLGQLIGPQQPHVVNMSYQNFIVNVPVDSVHEYLKTPAQFNVSSIHHFEIAWSNSTVDLRTIIATENIDGKNGILLTNVAGVRLKEKEDYISAFKEVHDVLCLNFKQNLTDTARKEWEFDEYSTTA